MHAKPLLLIHSDVNEGKTNHINSRSAVQLLCMIHRPGFAQVREEECTSSCLITMANKLTHQHNHNYTGFNHHKKKSKKAPRKMYTYGEETRSIERITNVPCVYVRLHA